MLSNENDRAENTNIKCLLVRSQLRGHREPEFSISHWTLCKYTWAQPTDPSWSKFTLKNPFAVIIIGSCMTWNENSFTVWLMTSFVSVRLILWIKFPVMLDLKIIDFNINHWIWFCSAMAIDWKCTYQFWTRVAWIECHT